MQKNVYLSLKWEIGKQENFFPINPKFRMNKESEDIKCVNASKVAPPVTGRSVKNNSFVLLAVLVLGIGIVSYGCFKRMKRKH